MKINISLDKKSIQNAIKQINELKKRVQKELPKVYLQKCIASIIEIANKNLLMVDIGFEVKIAIQNGWKISPVVGNKITLTNNAEFEKGKNLAVFVEFGVGLAGEQRSHDFASEAKYDYNVPTQAKDKNGYWYYNLESGADSMNIESNYYEGYNSDKGFVFKTAGSPATMFLYKAWKEFETSGLYKTLWEQAKAEVIG